MKRNTIRKYAQSIFLICSIFYLVVFYSCATFGLTNKPLQQIYSPDSTYSMRIEKLPNSYRVFKDTTFIGNYNYIVQPGITISPDGNHYAFVAAFGSKWSVVKDGKILYLCDGFFPNNGIVFNPKYNTIHYFAKEDTTTYLFTDNKKVGEYDFGTNFVFSKDGQRSAFKFASGDKWGVAVDGIQSRLYDKLSGEGIVFSPDSKHFGYIAMIGEKSIAVINYNESALYDGVFYITFSPDSKHVFYKIQDSDKQGVVMDGVLDKMYDAVYVWKWSSYNLTDFSKQSAQSKFIIFSDDGKHFTYTVKENDKEGISIDGAYPVEFYDEIGITFYWSSNHTKYAYWAKVDNMNFLNLSGVLTEEQSNQQGNIEFNNDASLVAFASSMNGKRRLVILNENSQRFESEEYDGYLSSFKFDGEANTFTFNVGAIFRANEKVTLDISEIFQ